MAEELGEILRSINCDSVVVENGEDALVALQSKSYFSCTKKLLRVSKTRLVYKPCTKLASFVKFVEFVIFVESVSYTFEI